MRRGIYRLNFADNDRYVGQSVNVVKRFSQHRRKWDDIVSFEFFPVPVGDLDALELQLIRATEQETGVRNIRGADKPGGPTELGVAVDLQKNVVLPWERDKRVAPGMNVADRDLGKFVKLASHPAYPWLRDLVGWYLFETCPDPMNTARHLWVVSCLPSTARSTHQRRLLAVNAGNLEVLVARETMVEGDAVYDLYINTTVFDYSPLMGELHEYTIEPERDLYNETSTLTWSFSIHQLDALVEAEEESLFRRAFLDAAYELNVRLMRRGGTMYRRFHNHTLATDLVHSSLSWGAPL